jgi:hypothetical protein
VSPAGASSGRLLRTSRPLTGVSCPSARVCTVFGDAFPDGTDPVVLVMRHSGGRWFRQPVPSPPDPVEIDECGVACTSRWFCAGVGSAYIGYPESEVPFYEIWRHGGWTVQIMPSPRGDSSFEINGMSCSSSTVRCGRLDAARTGTQIGAEPTVTLTEQCDGDGWTIVPTPSAVRPGSDLNGVSCAGPHVCTAVGDTPVGNRARWSAMHGGH